MTWVRRPGRRSRGDEGSALVELVWLGVLLLIPVVWILLSVFAVQNGAFGTSGAARAAGRAFALAPDDASGAARAKAAAAQVFADQDVDGDPRVSIKCSIRPCHSGNAVITIVVTTNVQLPLLPSVLGGGAPTFRMQSTHTFPIGQYVEVAGSDPR